MHVQTKVTAENEMDIDSKSVEHISEIDHQIEVKIKRKEDTVTRIVCGAIFIGSTFVAHLLTIGFSYSAGVYYLVFLEEFGQSNGLTSWVGSLNVACLLSSGPLASCILTRHGCSSTLMMGGLLGGLGLTMTAFSTSIGIVFVTYGIITGIGFGLVFTTAVSVITLQFAKWRKIAMGISMAGIGFGTFLHPFLSSILIETYGWRGAMLISGAVTLNTCVMALLVRLATMILETKTPKHGIHSAHNSLESAFIELQEKEKNRGICSREYFVLHVNNFLFCFGQSVVHTHIYAFAVKSGISHSLSTSLISVIGISSILGRILLGAISQHPLINITLLYSVCYAICGLCSFGYSIWTQYIVMMLFLALLGFSFGAYGPLVSELVFLTVGIDRFAHAFGYLMLSNGVGTLLGAPCAGWLYDVTSVYQYSFYLGGISFILSAFVMAVPKLLQYCN